MGAAQLHPQLAAPSVTPAVPGNVHATTTLWPAYMGYMHRLLQSTVATSDE